LTFRLSGIKGLKPCGKRPNRVNFEYQKPKKVYSYD
jgi:hypothetical protein